MGDGKVPFGHQGFQNRTSRFPIVKRSAGENVAYISGIPTNQIARVSNLFKLFIGNCKWMD